ncbi:MAG TPA: methyltransferase domain-containing protein [Thermoanaerobaculia bacterium]|nr:methyltransferase domain-containing protein [Thermoanaerobaculia bacterium]
MRRDWDARAREDAAHYIDCAHSETDESFWRSGAADLDDLILKDMTLDPSARVLEIGCGVGRLLRPLSDRAARVIGIDISPEMIARARAALADRRNLELRVTRGRLDGVADASLDFVYSFIVFQHVSSRASVHRYLREASRALAGGGVLRFQIDGRRRPRREAADTWQGVWFDGEAIRRRLERLKFDVVDRWGDGTQYFWWTARRQQDPGRPSTRAVALRARDWNLAALDRALADLGAGAQASAAIVAGRASLRGAAEPFLASHRDALPADFVRRAYDVVLGRPADPAGLAFYSAEIESGKPRGYVLDCLIASAEARDRFRSIRASRIEP